VSSKTLENYLKELSSLLEDFTYEEYGVDLKSDVVELPKFAKYAQILKSSVASKETANERIFLMKDLATVEEAVGLGAQVDWDAGF